LGWPFVSVYILNDAALVVLSLLAGVGSSLLAHALEMISF